MSINFANWGNAAIIPSNPHIPNVAIPTSVGTNGGPSFYGTFDQSGNVWEWTSTEVGYATRRLRGGAFDSTDYFDISRINFQTRPVDLRSNNVGFRLSTINNELNLPNFVIVGDPGNAPDLSSYPYKNGSVPYVYRIGMFTVTVCEYLEFLNAVASINDPSELYSPAYDVSKYILRLDNAITSPTKYSYYYRYTDKIGHNKPITGIGFQEAIRYCNWLHNGKPNGPQGESTTENGAYDLTTIVIGKNFAPKKNPNAKYYVTTDEEWYKAAFYTGNGLNSKYSMYATHPDPVSQKPNKILTVNMVGDGPFISPYTCNQPTSTPIPTSTPPVPTPTSTPVVPTKTPGPTSTPTAIPPTPTATPVVTATIPFLNSINAGISADWNNMDGNLTTVGTNGVPSYYGTYDQSGNVWEWNDFNEASGVTYRCCSGGSWSDTSIYSARSSNVRRLISAYIKFNNLGFRIASKTNALSLENMVLVSDATNKADRVFYTNLGAVNYNYYIGKYTITNCDYVKFLNAVAAYDTYNLFDTRMQLDPRGGIIRNFADSSFNYVCKPYMCNKPVIYVNWFQAARYCNWLHNGKPEGEQNFLTTENGAYPLFGKVGEEVVRKSDAALYYLPNLNEWYKAAFYKGGSTNAGYWSYATKSNSNPVAIKADPAGNGPFASTYFCDFIIPTPTATTPIVPTPSPSPSGPQPTPTSTSSTLPGNNGANWNLCAIWGPENTTSRVTTVGTNGGPSAYGTYDQSGNVWEWNDFNNSIGFVRGLRGGSWNSKNLFSLSSSARAERTLVYEYSGVGFRIASKDHSLSWLGLPQMVQIEDVGNKPDVTAYGAVNYSYYIGKYLITNCQYAEFLNAVAASDPYKLYTKMISIYGGIIRTGSPGNYEYEPKPNMSNKPLVYVNWLSAARYCNWLHWGKSVGGNSSITETGAYNLYGKTNNFKAFPKNADAKYYIPTENEWYKAAFYKGGGLNAGYWKYATQSDTPPNCVSSNTSGDGPLPSNYSGSWVFPGCQG